MAQQVEFPPPLYTLNNFNTTFPIKSSTDDVDNPPGNPSSAPYLASTMATTTTSSSATAMDAMKSERNRLETFKHPNWKCFMDERKLAKSGFYYFGVEDHVRCAFCKVEIGKWVPGDDCDSDHQRWGFHCPFLRGFDVGNIPLDPTLPQPQLRSRDVCGRLGIEVRPNSVSETFNNIDVQPVQEGGATVNLKDIGMNTHNGPKYKRYCTEESRIATFKEWPRVMKQKPAELAEAGFFYTGRGDQTTCFHCGLGLKDWEENDDPWEQHARWFSKCTHVLLNKGQEFVQQIVSKQPPILNRENAIELLKNCNSSTTEPASTSSTASTSSSSEASTSIVPSDEEKSSATSTVATTIESKSEKSPSSGDEGCLCQICYLERWNVLFLPCKHALACKKCAPLLTNCPLCREQISATLRIYPSCNHDHRDTS
ncbi:baculoviral IAP repeat-containing protein 3-like [Chrysoperla carnea]|uniref:baculoviral IAP repeat-containing protein 3-like n=1 Tax=Chrysoperla carnea TaxID=189513 RepID=UPI001D07BE70|nr:baculoviral IAP repeat-containing protein 3-like [Chrysoperla carnea]XP_044740158.1 baculoviral IAP repeat-containing protein 3-like [Chrysoperla carnea]XP_044740159.1 baculoviral IAP repeat-containing protein 3-like [Chrysoperla carnea]XP_044740160.1 baculoviral IAP repeat-containing protein 3-like [Chrysoperla carnea]